MYMEIAEFKLAIFTKIIDMIIKQKSYYVERRLIALIKFRADKYSTVKLLLGRAGKERRARRR